MNTSKLSKALKSVSVAMKKHSPEILTGIGIAGMITTAVMAVRATPKALVLIEEKKEELEVETLKPVETIKAAGVCYIPAALVCVASVACLVGASSVNLRRNAALATAYTLSETTLKEYQEKVVEKLGDKKEREIREDISKDKIQKTNFSAGDIIVTDKGNTVCIDAYSGRPFYSDIDKLKRIVNELNREMRNCDYISLNEYYDEIGLDHVKMGDQIGWHIDRGYIDLQFGADLKDDKPCIYVDYNLMPEYI